MSVHRTASYGASPSSVKVHYDSFKVCYQVWPYNVITWLELVKV